MYKNALTVTVRNLTSDTITLWCTRNGLTVPGNGSVELGYEPWSAADKRTAHDAMRAALAGKSVELTLHVRNDEGVTDIVYDPSRMFEIADPIIETVPASVVNAPAVTVTADKPAEDKLPNVVQTANESSGTLGRMGFKSEPVRPPSTTVKAQDSNSERFTITAAENSTISILTNLDKKGSASVEKNEAAEAEVAVDDTAEKFDALCAEHKWADALKLLVDKFGEDKITFTARAIMTLKTYAAVAAKYGL